MSKKKNDLGRGIRALLEGIDEELNMKNEMSSSRPFTSSGSYFIPLESIEVNPFQPRTQFDKESLQELADSIKVHGVIQPITVRKLDNNKYQLIAGERRLRASRMANIKEIPAFVKNATDQETLEIALVENIHREDLNPLEIGLTYKRLIEECQLNHEELAQRIGKNRATVTNFLRLLKLPPDVQAALKAEEITMGHAKALLSVEDPVMQLEFLKEIIRKKLSVREAEYLCKNRKSTSPGKKEKKQIPLEVRTLQKSLTDRLSTNVKIKHQQNGKGEITIRYYTESDLDRLYYLIMNEK